MQDNMVGQNIIITEKLSTLRQLGRNALRGKWKTAIIAMAIYIICLMLPALILNELFGYNPGNFMAGEGNSNPYNMDPEQFAELSNSLPHYSLLTSIYIILVSGAFELGISLFFLAAFRGHFVASKDIFLGFERFGKALGLLLYQTLFIFLWSLLFIIPGIIASIRYSQAFFVLADDPEKSIPQCVNESKMMMKGNKATYFLLCLSFIGWIILAGIPGGVLESVVQNVTENVVAIGAAGLIGDLFMVPVLAYLYSTRAGFYEILAGHLIKETQPAPVTAEQIDVAAPIEEIEEVIESVEEKEENKNKGDE